MPKALLSARLIAALATPLVALTPDQGRAYVDWMKQNLPEVPSWNEWQQRTGTLPPDLETLPSSNALPDSLKFLDGRPVRSRRAGVGREGEGR